MSLLVYVCLRERVLSKLFANSARLPNFGSWSCALFGLAFGNLPVLAMPMNLTTSLRRTRLAGAFVVAVSQVKIMHRKKKNSRCQMKMIGNH